MIDLDDLGSGLDQLGSIPTLVADAHKLLEQGQRSQGETKFQEALVIATAAQALLMLSLAKLAAEAGDMELCRSYCQTAHDNLETVGLEESALGKAAGMLLATLPE
ncbi:MAG TPA: hypothetical protein V6D08_02785 [Candidatus Obscuribacterales bacterium]